MIKPPVASRVAVNVQLLPKNAPEKKVRSTDIQTSIAKRRTGRVSRKPRWEAHADVGEEEAATAASAAAGASAAA
jgi:hypothetical protein